MRIPDLMVTREHGSWAVVLVPMIIAIGVTGHCWVDESLFLVTVLCAFLMYVPLQVVLRDRLILPQGEERRHQANFWLLAFGVAGFTSGTVLFLSGYLLLPLFGLAGAFSFLANFQLTRSSKKGVASDLAAVAGLTLGAPGMYYVGSGLFDHIALSLWILNFLFFGSGVFHVHMKMEASALKKTALTMSEKWSLGKKNIVYHSVVIFTVLVFTHFRYVPRLTILAFVPMVIHAVFGTISLSSRVRYKALGLVLLGQSIVFCILLVFLEHR
jgi:hypothetical protein